ncbi:anaerobic selenocysteine-containing dehydrogenase [Paenibacillus endophyticus]|uniref:Anaerobic selenocysteine-containing dehydrogenase n=1 Tax=Paenibacillus endophyticus TaxID=1294268 RepID=A0A7W5C5G1_9BACL|nr:molybdopterin oxidoreductase family protein [Paenibacillus endophyticus]MBB3151533.1 anaerobic selenocysteine-containing dehydrogenase [Paenibacillus endophyticus]
MSTIVQNGTVRSVCPFDCPDTCGLSVTIEEGKITKITGDAAHPVTRGAICNKVRQLNDRVYHPERLLYPMRRKGPKGNMDFERITWEEAYDEINIRMTAIIAKDGPQAILPYSFYGNMGVLNAEGMDRRFFHRVGASRLDRTICNAAGSAGYAYTMGGSIGIDPEETVHAKLFLIWGCNLVSTNMHQAMLATEARKNGATIIHIDVHRNRTSAWADQFIHLRPGTDAALALGMMHVIIRDGLADQAFLEQHAIGYHELAAQALAYTPEYVAGITGVPAEQIEELSRLYGKTTPSFIRIGNGLQHHDNGGMAIRTIACLPALTGQWGVRGGGAIKGNSWYSRLNADQIERPDLMPDPGVRTISMNQLGDALLDSASPVNLLFVYNSNPAVVAPDQNRVRKGLMRNDLFTVTHDLFLTDTCKYSDIVLPATSHFENLDLYTSYWHLYLQLHEPIMEPMGECKSNFTLFKELGLRLGFEHEAFDITEEQMIREALDSKHNSFLSGITFEALQSHSWMKAGGKSLPAVTSVIPTPSGRIELYSEQMLQDGYSPLPTHSPLKEPEIYPFLLMTGPNHSFINSTFANQERLQKLEKEPLLHMHSGDAEALGLLDGERVKVRNGRGEVEIRLRIGSDVLPGVLVTQGLWWDDHRKGHQAVNALTPQRLADMGGGATFFSNRVAVVRLKAT